MMKNYTRILFLFAATSLPLFSKPTGMNLIHGQAGPVQSDTENSWIIETGKKTILEWDQFSIGANETFTFLQKDLDSSVLNRIVGQNSTELLGALLSNGNVFVLNPNGVLIGPNAKIECASFIASTLDVLNADFLNSTSMLFSGKSKSSIQNLGTIQCPSGKIALLARSVKNQGTLSAKQVGIAASSEILLKLDEGSGMICLPIHLSAEESDEPSIVNEGEIHALITELKSTENPYSIAIQQSGLIDVNFDEETGFAQLIAENGCVEVSGTIQASSKDAAGGKVHVLGETVVLKDRALIDASGKTKGGEVLIGGDFQGKNPEIKNASFVWAGPDTQIRADALHKGDGGRVIFWSDDAMTAYGTISIQGGSLGGDGGLAEVSGKRLTYLGFTDAKAPFGSYGTLLLDPNDIVIGGAATTGSFSSCPNSNYVIDSSTATNQILNTALNGQLGSCNVTISTVGSTGSVPNGGSITVSSALSWSAQTTLTLDANSYISITAAITNTAAAGSFDAMNFRSRGATTGAYHGISITAALKATNGNIILEGYATQDNTALQGYSGVYVTNAITSTAGTVKFQNCLGAYVNNGVFNEGRFENHGVYITGASGSVIGAYITATDVVGGTGYGGANFGFEVYDGASLGSDGTLGTPDPIITIDATGGTASTAFGANFGCQINNASLTVGDTGSITIIGTGGEGFRQNYGINFFNATVTIGTGASAAATVSLTGNGGSGLGGSQKGVFIESTTDLLLRGNSTLTITGTGGTSFGGAADNQQNHGIHIADSTVVIGTNGSSTANITYTGVAGTGTLGPYPGFNIGVNYTDNTTTFNGTGFVKFLNCYGGSGGDANYGVTFTSNIITTTGSILFDTVVGGSTESDNYGVYLSSSGVTLTAPTITATGISGGAGIDNNYGFFVAGTSLLGVLSNFVLNDITIDATSLGTGINNHGIYIETTTGGIETGNIGVITLTGVGSQVGTAYNSGVALGNFNAYVEVRGGDLTVNGTSGAGPNSYGVYMVEGSFYASSGIMYLTADRFGFDYAYMASNADINVYGPITLLPGLATLIESNTDVNFYGTIDGAAPFEAACTDTLTFFQDIGSSVPLTSLSTTFATDYHLGGNITLSNAAISMNGFVTLLGGVIITTNGGAVSFPSTINGAHSLTIASGGGAITLGAAIGGTTPLTGLIVGGGTTTFGTNITVADGPITFSSATVLNGSPTLNAGTGTITFSGTLNATAAEGLTISSTGGTAIFSGVTGGSTALGTVSISSIKDLTISGAFTSGAITISNSSTFTLESTLTSSGAFSQNTGVGNTVSSGSIVTAGSNISFAGAYASSTSSSITTGGTVAGTISFAKTVNGTGALTLTANSIQFGSTVGNIAPLQSLSATAAGISVAADFTSEGAVTFTGPVTTSAPLTFLNKGTGGITFSTTLTAVGDILVLAPNTFLTFSGNIVATGATGYNVTIEGLGVLTFGGSIDATGGGNISITSSGESITLGDITTSGAGNILVAATISDITFADTKTITSGTGTVDISAGGQVFIGN
ncbi:MAG: hypothetical protein COT85_06550 [Chlamydiae bacterium CG10_big_fil_rev_8_21_14_0_10_42_34]|nr:MAG: hypothetical protein COT85_06550 [Chlamydiae bacterium CG10_big_fil_rev_8_21_14_0_10_42_34]